VASFTAFLLLFQATKDVVFSIKQHQGLISSKYHIAVVRISPKEVTTHHSSVVLRLNDDEKNDMVSKIGDKTVESLKAFSETNISKSFRFLIEIEVTEI